MALIQIATLIIVGTSGIFLVACTMYGAGWLEEQAKKINAIMATSAEILALIAEQKTVIEEVAGDIAELVAKLETGLSTEETQKVFDALKLNVDKLKEAAAVVPEPPVEPETPVEG